MRRNGIGSFEIFFETAVQFDKLQIKNMQLSQFRNIRVYLKLSKPPLLLFLKITVLFNVLIDI